MESGFGVNWLAGVAFREVGDGSRVREESMSLRRLGIESSDEDHVIIYCAPAIPRIN